MAESNRKRDFEEALKHCEALASSLKPAKQKKHVEYVFLRDPVGERQTHCKYRPKNLSLEALRSISFLFKTSKTEKAC